MRTNMILFFSSIMQPFSPLFFILFAYPPPRFEEWYVYSIHSAGNNARLVGWLAKKGSFFSQNSTIEFLAYYERS